MRQTFKFSYRIFPAISLLFLLSSCNKDILSIHSEYITIESLSSYYVGTPDPKLDNPPFGQKLVIEWELPKERSCTQDTALILTIRFRDRSQETITVYLKKRSGRYIYCLNRDQYCERGEILTYKAQIFQGPCLLEEWKHQLWAELILLEEDGESEMEEDDSCCELSLPCCEEKEKTLEELYEENQFLP